MSATRNPYYQLPGGADLPGDVRVSDTAEAFAHQLTYLPEYGSSSLITQLIKMEGRKSETNWNL